MAVPSPTSPSSPATSRPRTSSRTDKRALLDALAAQLRVEKTRTEEWAQKMVEVEDEVQAKHAEFLDEEARLSAQRDTNAATIASLRRELARVNHALEEALVIEQDEAEAYLSLLSSEAALQAPGSTLSKPLKRGSAPPDVGRSGSDELGYPSRAHAQFVEAGRTPSPNSTFIASPRPERPTSHIVGHPYQQQQSSPSYPVLSGARFPDALRTSSHLALHSVGEGWPNSSGDVSGAGAVQPELLQKHGGRWSKVFPNLVRRRSSSRG
ncbi:hypothetical protein Rhopal_007303-T1 [Rhodotorula paludigena]|uniref:Proteophosphoglycan ppg4 n=1 Tax=Rhodotorula paludigena TaxID=86838 RepID=A0AAV5GW82_9BASI|nr:hypothetical protein Rhopal_007303-T1 [Rhodotorula paludigena]